MESAAREMNLTDVAERLEKIIHEASAIRQRIEESADTLRGSRATDEMGSNKCPEPSGLVPLLASRLSTLESIMHDQRQGLNRLAEGLREAPPPPVSLGGLNSISTQAKYANR